MKKIKIFILLFVIFNISNVKAQCDTNLNISLANNIAYSYKYNGHSFDLTFTNLENNFYIIDDNNNYYSGYNETTIYGLNPNKNYTFKIYPSRLDCENSLVRTINVKMPSYNSYYDLDICKDYKNFKYCKRWYHNNLTLEELEKKIEDYKQELANSSINEASYKKTTFDKIIDILIYIYVRYYYIILPIIILGVIYIIYLLDKKDSLF